MSGDLAAQFDVFLVRGCLPVPDADVLSAPPLSPAVASTVLQSAAFAATPDKMPGFLGIRMTKRIAWELMGHLRTLGADGDIVEIAYRTPTIAVDEAHRRAEDALAILQVTKYHEYTFAPLILYPPQMRDHARWWVFFASSPELIAQERIPGGLVIHIDKVDGHAATASELELLGMEAERLVYLFPNWRRASA